jgi:protein subunit release factor B
VLKIGIGNYMNMIQVTDTIALNENEIQFEFIRASGPGGQNVNKVSTAVQLRFDAAGSSAINDTIYERVKILTQRARLWLPLEGGRLPFAPKGGKVELSPWI